MKTAFIAITAVALAALPLRSVADGGWLSREWDPERTNSITRLPMPKDLYSPRSAEEVASAPRAVRSAKSGAPRLSATSGSVPFSPAGLEGCLPAADDSRIQELARGLDHNWERCFDFVRNYIVYTPYPGIMKGPERTLLDREGNAADQSFLLCALLRASGYDSATVLYMPLDDNNGFILPLFNIGSRTPYNAYAWLDPHFRSNYTLARKLISNGLDLRLIGDDHIAIEHYWVRVEIEGNIVHLDPSIKPQPIESAENAKWDSRYNRSDFLAAAGGTVYANSVQNLSQTGIAAYLKDRVADLKAAWNAAGASPSSVLGSVSITPRAADEPMFHGEWSSISEPIDLLSAPAGTVNALRTPVRLDSSGNQFRRMGGNAAFDLYFYLDEVGPRTLWFGKDSAGDLGFFVGETEIAHSDYWLAHGGTAVGVNVDKKGCSTQNPYTMLPEDGHVHVLSINLGGDDVAGVRKVATRRIAELRDRGLTDDNPILRAATLQLQGLQWLSQVERYSRLWSRVVGGEESHYYNIGIAGQTTGPFVDMANSYARGWGGSGIVKSHMMFSSALEHSVIEQLNGADNQAVSTVKILSLANASGVPIYFANSNNYSSVMSALSGYSAAQKDRFASAAQTGEIYLLPGSASVTLNSWSGMGYLSYGKSDDGGYHTGMIISGGMNGGYSSLVKILESLQYVANAFLNTDHQRGDVGSSTQADPVVMPAGAYIDEEIDLSVTRALPMSWTRSYDTRSSGTDGDLGRGWSHGFEASILETTDVDAALGDSSLDAVLPTVAAAVAAEDMMSETTGLSSGEIARRWTAAALVANWWTEQLPQTCVAVKIGAKAFSFQRMPDGSYAPAPGVAATLTRGVNGAYSLQERHGSRYSFNVDKKLELITDPSGNTTSLAYSNGRLASVENSFGASMTIDRDGSGRIASVVDNSGKRVYYAYDANGCMVSVTDTAGNVWHYVYDPLSYRMTSKTNPNGDILICNTYNAYGQVTNQVSSNGAVWRFGYAYDAESWNEDPNGRRLSETFDSNGRAILRTRRDGATSTISYDGHGHVAVATDPLGNRTVFTYDADDNLLATAEGSGVLSRTTRFAYDDMNRLVAVTNALGHVTRYSYDDNDRIVRMVNPDGTYTVNDWNANGTLAATHLYDASDNEIRTTAISYGEYGLPTCKTLFGIGLPYGGISSRTEYDESGLVTAQIDASGNRTSLAYDQAGRLVSMTDPLGNAKTFTYDNCGRVCSVRDPLGHESVSTYTASGLLLTKTLADGSTTRTEYDALESVVATVDARGARRTVLRDAEGRPIAATDSLGNISETIFDDLGRPISTTDSSGVRLTTEYDALSRPVATINAAGARWTTSYDKLDRAVSVVTPLGNVSKTSYDMAGQIVSMVRPSRAVDSFGYDAMGNQTTYTNSEGRVSWTSYDALGRVLSSTNALGVEVAAMAYDQNGNLASVRDGNGIVRTHTYDALGRLVCRMTPDGIDSFEYDAAGNLLTVSNITVRETFSYDVLNRLAVAVTDVSGMVFRTEWMRDAGGLATNVVYAPNMAVSKEYDIEGRLISVSDWLGHVWSFDWDGAGRLVRLSSPDGRIRTQSYDAMGRLVSWNVGDVVGRTVEYDLSGRKICDKVTAGAMPILQDLRHAKNVFDMADRIVSSTVELGDGSTRFETFFYDGNDAMVRAVADDKNVTFRYNANGALVGFSPSSAEMTFGYDALGNRILAGDHIWIPDQDDTLKRPLMEYDTSGKLVRAYIWSGAMLLGYIDAEGMLVVAHTDEHASIVALSQTNGAILHTAQYGAHGEDWGGSGSNPTPFAWLGGFGVQRLSGESFLGDLYLTRHRIYAPTQQRFLSADPMGLAGGLNLFAYGNCNPVAYVDPLGLCAESLGEKGSKGNPYAIGERPSNNVYHKGEYIRLSDGSLYQLEDDSYMEFSLTGESMKMYLAGKKPIRNILYDVDPEGFINHEFSTSVANNRIVFNNYAQGASALGQVYQAATSSAPSPSTEVGKMIPHIVDGAFAINDLKDLPSKMLPLIPEKATSRSSGPVHQNVERRQSRDTAKKSKSRYKFIRISNNPFATNNEELLEDMLLINLDCDDGNIFGTAKSVEEQIKASAGDQIIIWVPGQYVPSLIIKLKLHK